MPSRFDIMPVRERCALLSSTSNVLRFLLIAWFLLPNYVSSAEFANCNSTGTQLEMTACAVDEFIEADKKLNEAYQALLKKEMKNTVFIQKLRKTQKAWLAFRDAELEAMFSCAEEDARLCWGSMLPMCYSSYKAKLTRERTQRLQQFLDKGPPADECH